MPSIRYQEIPFPISPLALTPAPIDAQVDATASRVTGILFTSVDNVSIGRLQECGMAQNLTIEGREVFPTGYPVRDLMTGFEVKPNDRFYELDMPTNGGRITTQIAPNTAGAAGTGVITLRLEIPDGKRT